ncbi:MarC family protein [Thiogranum longum]|jgi:multiple antibiotic resistance protein
MEMWTEYTRFFTALLVILDPFAAIPVFLALTPGYSKAERSRAALVASMTVAIILIITAVTGESLLRAIGASLASFRVGGGIVLMLMALSMLRGETGRVRANSIETAEAESKQTVAVVPIAIPLLAGPGAISTVIIEMHRFTGLRHTLLVVTVILVICLILWLVLRAAAAIGDALGRVGLNIVNRLFGLVLTAIAVEIMANGLKELFPALAG